MASKPQLAAVLAGPAPDLIDPMADDAPQFTNLADSGLVCETCGEPALWFDGFWITCERHRGKHVG